MSILPLLIISHYFLLELLWIHPRPESGAAFVVLSLDSSSGSIFQMFRLHKRSASTPGAHSSINIKQRVIHSAIIPISWFMVHPTPTTKIVSHLPSLGLNTSYRPPRKFNRKVALWNIGLLLRQLGVAVCFHRGRQHFSGSDLNGST